MPIRHRRWRSPTWGVQRDDDPANVRRAANLDAIRIPHRVRSRTPYRVQQDSGGVQPPLSLNAGIRWVKTDQDLSGSKLRHADGTCDAGHRPAGNIREDDYAKNDERRLPDALPSFNIQDHGQPGAGRPAPL
jgi:hypothetical protein